MGQRWALCVPCLGVCVLTHLGILNPHPVSALPWAGPAPLLSCQAPMTVLICPGKHGRRSQALQVVTGPRGLFGSATVCFFSTEALALVTNGSDGPTDCGCQLG